MPASLVLRLFVSGRTARAVRAVEAAERLCAEHAGEDYQLDVVDILEDPAAAEEARVVATPTLVRLEPQPKRSVVGDLEDTARVADILGFARADTDLARGLA